MSEKEIEKKSLTSKLHFFLTVVAVLAPLFYLTGLSFHQGYLTTYGISSDAFPINVQDTYVDAHIAISLLWLPLFNSIKNILIWLVTGEGITSILLFLLSIAILLFLLKKLLSSKNYLELSSSLRSKAKDYHWDTNDFSLAFSLAGIVSYLIFAFIYIPFGLFCLWILPSVLGHIPAKELANKNIDNYLQNGCYYETDKRWSNCKTLQSKDGKILYQGIVIATSETRIAFFTKSGAIVTQIPDGALIINTPKGL